MAKVHDQAGTASGEKGEVMQDGPDGVGVSMTPKAARETAKSLTDAADAAERDGDGPRPPAEQSSDDAAHHPLPASDKARHDEIPETIERERDSGDD